MAGLASDFFSALPEKPIARLRKKFPPCAGTYEARNGSQDVLTPSYNPLRAEFQRSPIPGSLARSDS
jgi:hypothetical protein